MKYDTIIIGAGAAGLMAMRDLLQAGRRVCLLEASALAGGRIATVAENGFNKPVETGAEFVHGKLPLTLGLLDKAGIDYIPVKGKMIAVQNEKWRKHEEHDKHWGEFLRQLGKLKTDTSIAEFLEQYFPGIRYASLRQAVRLYAEGFDLADITKASAMAARREWSHEEEMQYRIPGGYGQLINFLLRECDHPNAAIHFNACVSQIQYNNDAVILQTTDNREFEAFSLLITVSAGVLQSGALQFVPALDAQYAGAIGQLGYGDVIKVLLQFTTPFWETWAPHIGFLLSDETIPTWWTQSPLENNLLTGWLGGPAATFRSGDTDADLLQLALQSLSAIFDLPTVHLQAQLVHHKIICWRNYAYIKGGYSYITTGSATAKKILSHPVQGRIFFAGEALYQGQSQGTVEAALQSGLEMAKKIRDLF